MSCIVLLPCFQSLPLEGEAITRPLERSALKTGRVICSTPKSSEVRNLPFSPSQVDKIAESDPNPSNHQPIFSKHKNK